MRFEHAAAYAMGVGLPLLEALRRRTNFTPLHSYVDDFIAGAFLLYAARAVSRGRPNGPVLLVAAWAVLAGGLYGSFFWQFTATEGADVSGHAHATVAAVKGVLYAITLASLVLAIRTAGAARTSAAR